MTPATIVYVDDDPDDRAFLKEAFDKQQNLSVLYFADGSSLLTYLNSIKEDALLPKLIITDINMPEMTGIELLSILKSNARLKQIKVIVFSTAKRDHYQKECTRLGAAAFLQKPNSFSEMQEMASYFMYQ